MPGGFFGPGESLRLTRHGLHAALGGGVGIALLRNTLLVFELGKARRQPAQLRNELELLISRISTPRFSARRHRHRTAPLHQGCVRQSRDSPVHLHQSRNRE